MYFSTWDFYTETNIARDESTTIHRISLYHYNRPRSRASHQSLPLEASSDHFLRCGYLFNMQHSGRLLQCTLMQTDFRSQWPAAFGSETGTQATEFFVWHTQPRDSMIFLSASGSSSMSSTMRLLVGETRHVCWMEAKSWGRSRGGTGEGREWDRAK